MSAEYEQVQVQTREGWRTWLGEHATTSPGIWLVTWKKGAGPYLEWISTAKTDSTRARRIQQTVDEAAAGRRANQWRQPKTG